MPRTPEEKQAEKKKIAEAREKQRKQIPSGPGVPSGTEIIRWLRDEG